MTIKELNNMNKQELMLWCFSVKVKDLNEILKAEGMKGLSKLKKADKVKMLSNMIEAEQTNIDEEIETIYNETKAINEEINSRQTFKEEFEQTLYARFDSSEITLEELRKIVNTYKLDIPVMSNRENTIDIANRYGDLACSEYMTGNYHIDCRGIEYEDLFVEEDHKWYNYDEQILYTYNNLSSENYTLGYQCDEYGDYYFVIYRDKQVIAMYKDIEKSDLDKLFTVDVQAKEDKELLYKLLEDFMKQYNEYQRLYEEHETMRQYEYKERQKDKERYEKAWSSWTTYYQPYTMGKWTFEELWDEKGNIKNYSKWSEMTSFVSEERDKKFNQSYQSAYNDIFGSLSVKKSYTDEQKEILKKIYKASAVKLHPDITKDNGEAFKFLNELKESWGI